MIVEFDRSFYKSLDKITDRTTQGRIFSAIHDLEHASSIHEIKNIKKLVGFRSYYRIKIGDYRLGFETIGRHRIRLIIAGHRKDIYRRFP